jgi:DNA-directed RNA polymerase subunit RPC12/RpoP
MNRADDQRFGRIAVAQRMVTPEQLAECLAAQAMLDPAPPLEKVLLDRKLITGAQRDQVLRLMREGTTGAVDPATRQTREGELFGRLAVQQGYATAAEVDACVRLQTEEVEQGKPPRSLGEIMVERGCLTASQVHRLLSAQKKVMMVCMTCKARFNVVTAKPDAAVACPKCRGLLMPAQAGGGYLRQEATLIMRASAMMPAVSAPAAGAKAAPAPPKPAASPPVRKSDTTTLSRPAPSRVPGGTSRLQKGTADAAAPPAAKPAAPPAARTIPCPICDHSFAAAPDASGWVKCPECGTGFMPKS